MAPASETEGAGCFPNILEVQQRLHLVFLVGIHLQALPSMQKSFWGFIFNEILLRRMAQTVIEESVSLSLPIGQVLAKNPLQYSNFFVTYRPESSWLCEVHMKLSWWLFSMKNFWIISYDVVLITLLAHEKFRRSDQKCMELFRF